MNRAGKIALGCLLAPVGFLALILFFLAIGRVAGVPESRTTSATLEQPISEGSKTGSAVTNLERVDGSRTRPGENSPNQGLQDNPGVTVTLNLEEGQFEIVPGPADEGIRVDADYDEATYELTQKYDVDGKGHPTYELKFKSRVSLLRRLANWEQLEESEHDNHVIVQLPVNTPMILNMRISKGESEVDLSGLALRGLKTNLRMGEHGITVDEVNPIDMEELDIDTSMGEFGFDGLSRLRARKIEVTGSMGEVRVDLGGPLEIDTELFVSMKMGELSLFLPDNAIWDSSGLKAALAEVGGSTDGPQSLDPETSPVLRLDGSVFLGEIIVDSYSTARELRRRSNN